MNLIQLILEGITYKIPNFNFEWEEAIRYPEFKKLGKQAWISIASKGKGVSIDSAKDISNTDANKPGSFKLLDKDCTTSPVPEKVEEATKGVLS